MIISFLEGSRVVEPDVEDAVSRQLRQLIRSADSVDFYFYTSAAFSLECEWIVRKLQACFPEKRFSRNIVIDAESPLIFPRCRFDRMIKVDCQKAADVWRWMVDCSDYICGYMHPYLCSSSVRLAVWNYAQKAKPGRCFNFASDAAWNHVCAQIPKLVYWQRETFSRKLLGEPKSDIARFLGVSKTTVRMYELAAQHSLEEKAYTAVLPNRTCAILGFAATAMGDEQRRLLFETLWYLAWECQVHHFIVQHAVEHQMFPVMQVLSDLNRQLAVPVKISSIQPAGGTQELPHARTNGGHINRGLKERESMIACADIVLCSIENLYGSGLNYARRKHIPVINLSEEKFKSTEVSS